MQKKREEPRRSERFGTDSQPDPRTLIPTTMDYKDSLACIITLFYDSPSRWTPPFWTFIYRYAICGLALTFSDTSFASFRTLRTSHGHIIRSFLPGHFLLERSRTDFRTNDFILCFTRTLIATVHTCILTSPSPLSYPCHHRSDRAIHPTPISIHFILPASCAARARLDIDLAFAVAAFASLLYLYWIVG